MKFLNAISLVLIVMMLASEAPAQILKDDKSTGEKIEEAVDAASDQVKKTFGRSRERREDASIVGLLNYSLLDLVVPSKTGITVGYALSANTTWELEYLRASVGVPFLADIGAMTDQRTSVIRRSFLGKNSFNLSYGITYFDYSIHLGHAILNRISSNYPSGLDLIIIQGLGFNVAIGNRWTVQKNVTIGIDWLSLAQPVVLTGKKSGILNYISNDNDRQNVSDVIKFVSYFPRFAAIKLQLGIMF